MVIPENTIKIMGLSPQNIQLGIATSLDRITRTKYYKSTQQEPLGNCCLSLKKQSRVNKASLHSEYRGNMVDSVLTIQESGHVVSVVPTHFQRRSLIKDGKFQSLKHRWPSCCIGNRACQEDVKGPSPLTSGKSGGIWSEPSYSRQCSLQEILGQFQTSKTDQESKSNVAMSLQEVAFLNSFLVKFLETLSAVDVLLVVPNSISSSVGFIGLRKSENETKKNPTQRSAEDVWGIHHLWTSLASDQQWPSLCLHWKKKESHVVHGDNRFGINTQIILN